MSAPRPPDGLQLEEIKISTDAAWFSWFAQFVYFEGRFFKAKHGGRLRYGKRQFSPAEKEPREASLEFSLVKELCQEAHRSTASAQDRVLFRAAVGRLRQEDAEFDSLFNQARAQRDSLFFKRYSELLSVAVPFEHPCADKLQKFLLRYWDCGWWQDRNDPPLVFFAPGELSKIVQFRLGLTVGEELLRKQRYRLRLPTFLGWKHRVGRKVGACLKIEFPGGDNNKRSASLWRAIEHQNPSHTSESIRVYSCADEAAKAKCRPRKFPHADSPGRVSIA